MSPNPLGVAFDDPRLEASVRHGLDEVEAMLATAVLADDDLVGEAAAHLMSAGGKRFRPLVSVLSGQFGDPTQRDIIAAATVCELTHLATLYHDDVMDEAPVRRGSVSANSRWGNSVAILTGDFLFSRASNILADLGPYAVRLQAQTFERLVVGQIRETVGPGDGDPIAHYLGVLADKTGSLIATSAEFGAHYAQAPATDTAALRAFGEQIGVAFQLSDDILDIASDSAESGKTPGTDLRAGVATLPVLYALRSADPADDRLRTLITHPLVDDAEHAEALKLLRASAALDEARQTLRDYADRARAVLTGLPDVAARRALFALTDLVMERTG